MQMYNLNNYYLVCHFSYENKSVDSLKPGDPAQTVLVQQLPFNPFLRQIELCTHGRHTGTLEVLHSLFLAYVSKRIDYNPPSYIDRIQLALLDHNENCQRKPLLGKVIKLIVALRLLIYTKVSLFSISVSTY